jgi:hypothetical protein
MVVASKTRSRDSLLLLSPATMVKDIDLLQAYTALLALASGTVFAGAFSSLPVHMPPIIKLRAVIHPPSIAYQEQNCSLPFRRG